MKPPLALLAFIVLLFTSPSWAYQQSASLSPPDSEELCLPDPAWFESGQPEMPNGKGVTAFCNFHQWSWQMFLYLTDNDTKTKQPRFLSWLTPNQLLKGADTSLAFDERLQAGSDAMLVDQQGRLVYYSQYLNDDFVQLMRGIDQSVYGVITTEGVTAKALSSDFATNFDTVLQRNDMTSFPVNAIELKASWMIVPKGKEEEFKGYFQMQAQVTPLKNTPSEKIEFDDEAKPLNVTVAMVGLHIGGVVEGHPEMIWASFENVANAPNEPQNKGPSTVISDEHFTFYKKGTTAAQCNRASVSPGQLTLDEISQVLTPSTQVCRQYALGSDPSIQNMRVDQNIRDITSMNTAAKLNFANVLMECEKTNSKNANCQRAAIWQNYFEVGAIWFSETNALVPGMTLATDCYDPEDPTKSVSCPNAFTNSDVQQLLIGSLVLSNATIETFTQNGTAENNCFRCHNTAAAEPEQPWQQPLKASNLNISHAFKNLYFRSQQKSSAK